MMKLINIIKKTLIKTNLKKKIIKKLNLCNKINQIRNNLILHKKMKL